MTLARPYRPGTIRVSAIDLPTSQKLALLETFGSEMAKSTAWMLRVRTKSQLQEIQIGDYVALEFLGFIMRDARGKYIITGRGTTVLRGLIEHLYNRKDHAQFAR